MALISIDPVLPIYLPALGGMLDECASLGGVAYDVCTSVAGLMFGATVTLPDMPILQLFYGPAAWCFENPNAAECIQGHVNAILAGAGPAASVSAPGIAATVAMGLFALGASRLNRK